MRITRIRAIQAHPVPEKVHEPRGPFPQHLFDEPEIVSEYDSEYDEGGSNFQPGATAQNDYKPLKVYRCKFCDERVTELDLHAHTCEE